MSVLTGIAGSLVGSGDMFAYAEFAPSKEVLPKMAALTWASKSCDGEPPITSYEIPDSFSNPGACPVVDYSSDYSVITDGILDYESWVTEDDDGGSFLSLANFIVSDGSAFSAGLTYKIRCANYEPVLGYDFSSYCSLVSSTKYSCLDEDSVSDTVYEICFKVSSYIPNGKKILSVYFLNETSFGSLSFYQTQWNSYFGTGSGSKNIYSKGFYQLISPVILKSGGSKDLYYSVDADTSQATIVGGVSAKDLFGVDVPVTVKSSDYVAGKVGDYTIVLAATDSYGNTATATLRIHVVDRTAPVVTKKSEVSVAYGTSLTAEDVLSHYSIADNVDTSFTTSWTLPSNFSWGSALAYGTYALVLDVKDTAGNETKIDVSVNVFDNIPPVISRKDGLSETTLVYGYSTSYALTLDKILALYKAADVVSGTCDVYVKSGSIDTSVGDHSLVLAAKDKCGNEAVKTVNYHIQVDIPPVFILSDTLVQVENNITLSVNDLTSIVESIVGSGSSVSAASKARMAVRPLMAGGAATNIKINEDDFSAYVDGAGKAGTSYQIRYTYDDADGEVKSGALIVSVVESVGEPEESNPFILFFTKTIPDFISKLGKAFADLFQRIVNFFSFKGWNTDAELAPSSVPSSSADPSVSE